MWPLGHFPGQGCLCNTGEPPLPGVLDEGRRRVCPAVGLRHGRSPVGEPPVQPPGGGLGEGGTRGIPNADHCPGMARPPIPVVDHAVRRVPKAVAAPTGPAPLPPGLHGPDASPQVAHVGLPAGLPGGVAGTHVPTTPANPPPTVGPRRAGGAPGRGPGRTTHDGTPPHGHTAPRESAREGGTQRFQPAEPPGDAPTTRSAAKPRPSSLGPPRRDTPESLPPAGGGAI